MGVGGRLNVAGGARVAQRSWKWWRERGSVVEVKLLVPKGENCKANSVAVSDARKLVELQPEQIAGLQRRKFKANSVAGLGCEKMAERRGAATEQVAGLQRRKFKANSAAGLGCERKWLGEWALQPSK
mmetsp:Transcript_17363/g.42478  ORF Transcript_17363/g.42478 Transcript_17363/m.42478 type:complete len:128 (-) Transcript_17363:1531-1914(-)